MFLSPFTIILLLIDLSLLDLRSLNSNVERIAKINAAPAIRASISLEDKYQIAVNPNKMHCVIMK